MKSVLNIHWKDWNWSWNSNTLATWCEELTHWKRLRCWERLKVEGEGDDRGWNGRMASPTQWTWVWTSFGSWWWTGKPGVVQPMGPQSQTQVTEMNWTDNPKICNERLRTLIPVWRFIISSIYTILLLFYILRFWPWGIWDCNSLTRDWTCSPYIGKQSLNHWTTRQAP